MAKSILLIAAAALAMPAFAQVTSIESSNPLPKGKYKDPKAKICERISATGSRLANKTVCMTAAEWEELRRDHRDQTELIQKIKDFPDIGS